MTALEALKAKFPGKKIESIEFYKIDNTLYVDNKALAQLFDVTARTVENWKKKLGLEHTKLSPPKVQIYPFFDVLNWHFENVKTANASLGKGSTPIKYPLPKQSTPEAEDINDITEQEARRRKTILEIKQKELDLAKEKGKLVPIEDFGRGQAEPVMMIFGYLRTFFSRWPYSFVGKTEDVIRKEMDEDIAKMVSSIQTDITRKIGETIDLSYYDAMQALIESGKTPEEIISLVS